MTVTDHVQYVNNNDIKNPWWYLLCDASVLIYGYWTILCHICVTLEKNLYFLLGFFLISSIIMATIIYLYKRDKPPSTGIETKQQFTANMKFQNILFWILVFSILFLTLISHRSDMDDNRYINRAVAIADNPSEPLLLYDGRHNINNVPVKLSSKLYSNGILAGALSYISGIPAIYFPHMVFSAFAAILSVMAFGRLFRILSPDYWAFALLALFVFLISDGMVHRTFGNFSIVRLHQGKGILVTVVVPLIIVYAFDFMRKPIFKNWLLLFFAHIVAIGFCTSSLLVAPLTSLFSLITYSLYSRRISFRRRLLPGVLASIYILLILGGLFYYGQKQWPGRRAFIGVLPPPPKKQALLQKNQKTLTENLYFLNTTLVFGKGRFAVFCGFIVLTAWIWAPTSLAKSFCIVFPIGVAAVFLLPFTSRLVPYNFYWRIYWILPMSVLAGLALTAPLNNKTLRKHHPIFRFSLFFLLLFITLFGISERSILARSNWVTIGFPGLKVNSDYKIAQYINRRLADRPNVLTPSKVSFWLPTFHHHPYPMVTRYLADKILGAEAQERMTLASFIDGRKTPDISNSFFGEQLAHFDIELVCFQETHPRRARIIETLKSAGYRKDTIIDHYEIWVR